MKTKILKAIETDEAVNLLKDGEIIALPTETVYGLAADAKNELAIHKIFIAKKRPTHHPLIVHIDSKDKMREWASDISIHANKLAEHFWPGPLTIILPKRKEVSDLITGGTNTIALRVPNHAVALEIIKKLGNGIVAPSANAHQKTSPTMPEHVLKTLNGKIAAIITGDSCNVGIESTIIDMRKEIPSILRPGAITAAMMEKVLNISIEQPSSTNEKVPGNMKDHYQPEKPLCLVSTSEIDKIVHTEHNVALMHYSPISTMNTIISYKMPGDKSNYAKILYNTLHLIDSTDVDKIFVEKPPAFREWDDINDRLAKASFKQKI